MEYVYTVLWFMMAALLYSKFKSEGKIVYILSGYFVFAGIWWLANQFVAADLMTGTYGMIFRGVSVIALVVLILAYIEQKRHAERAENENENK